MRKLFLQNRFLKDYSYLLLISLLLFSISVFTAKSKGNGAAARSYARALEKYIARGEKDFQTLCADTALIRALAAGTQSEAETRRFVARKQFNFIYKTAAGSTQLVRWNTQAVLPDSATTRTGKVRGFVQLPNGRYFFQKAEQKDVKIISLLPVKWDYAVSNDYLENNFAADPAEGKYFSISAGRNGVAVSTRENEYLFSLEAATGRSNANENLLTTWLRIAALFPLLLFIHLAASHIRIRRGLFSGAIFLAGTLVLLRVISYFRGFPVSFRRFELFDPTVYGSNMVLRSLGDLLINAVLFFWIIYFINFHLKGRTVFKAVAGAVKKNVLLFGGVILLVIVTYIGSAVVRSMVADSQISFDVVNFFSLNLYSVIGFVVLCCIAVGYYYFCRIILFFIKTAFPDFMLPFFLSVTVAALLLLSLKAGFLPGGFELCVLIWLLLFLLLVKNDLSGFFTSGLIISKLVFWLFFFSASIASIIISENGEKEMRNRRHYAELAIAKTDPINEVLLSTMLKEFRPEMLAERFNSFTAEETANAFRDSLVSNNFSGYTAKYDTKVLVYDSLEMPLGNRDDISYNAVNSIYNTQSRPASVPGLYYYEGGYNKFSYLSRQSIKNRAGELLAYVFIVVSPRDFESDLLYPDIFSRGNNTSLENSDEYAFAIYDRGRLVTSHNDYAFSSRYPGKYFAGRPFLSERKQQYSELWYNAGNEKYVVIVKENRFAIELITLFSYLFCAFLILSAIAWLVKMALRSRMRLGRLRAEMQFTIRQQVHGTVIFFSAASFIIIGVATILFFISRYESNNKETLNRTIKIMEKELTAGVSDSLIQGSRFGNSSTADTAALSAKVAELSRIYGPDVNLYSRTGDLKASSLPLPYTKGIVSTKVDPLAFFHLGTDNEIQYFQEEHIGGLSFVSAYIPVTAANGNNIGFLNIPYFTSQTRLKEEISNFLVTIINLNAFIFLIAGMVALIITNRITRSFSFISDKMKSINLGTHNEAIEWKRNDEIGALVREYNRMLAKLEESAAALARTERENAWQEMAKQVAHEIKNPLTPMKLSMQFLQRSIENGAPDIKELGRKVSATLVEQIDHLSTIAGEFSRFANIENANPEVFNLNEALRSVQQLYEGDHKTKFILHLVPDPVMIRADKTHINRILTNLILNGIQSVPADRQPKILIEEKIIEGIVTIEIRDNGSGISEAVREKIFTPNFTTKSSGTGLGLAMCKRMAEQAGGDITYETSAEGTSFFIKLPRVKA